MQFKSWLLNNLVGLNKPERWSVFEGVGSKTGYKCISNGSLDKRRGLSLHTFLNHDNSNF